MAMTLSNGFEVRTYSDEERWVLYDIVQMAMADKDYQKAAWCLRRIDRDLWSHELERTEESRWADACWKALVDIMTTHIDSA